MINNTNMTEKERYVYILRRPDRNPGARFGAYIVEYHETLEGAMAAVPPRRWYEQKRKRETDLRCWFANHDMSIHAAELLP